MLTELRIRDVGVIADAAIEPGPGFTAITGETGAGKTMVVTGLALLLGAKADPRLIRIGAGRAIVEGRFVVDAGVAAAAEGLGAELDDGELLVARQLTGTRSRAFAGGSAVPVKVAAGLLAEWVTLHGQSEQLRLGTPDRQREVIDLHAGPELAQVLQRYQAAYAERAQAATELAGLQTAARERARELDVLQFGLDEIERIGPQPGEDVALAAEAQRLQSADDLRLAASTALAGLAGTTDDLDAPDATGLLAAARRTLESASRQDPALAAQAERLAVLGYEVADVAQDLASYLADLDADPSRLEWIAGRRSALQTLTRKYGADCDEVLAWAAEGTSRAASLRGADERIEELAGRVDALSADLTEMADAMTRLRTAAATSLAETAVAELAALAMPHAVLRFEVGPLGRLGPDGADDIALLFAANPGSAPGPLAKVASGGELSRVRLALEVVLAGDTPGQVFIFDEVDAGIGGATALEVGRRLRSLSAHSQVIVVTHLAQVAAFADRHFVVTKTDTGEVTTSGIVSVAGDARLDELARMMGGEATAAGRARAAELLELGAG
ncbi:DNA repair protein RecN [Propionicicella superfundia]|uniref:DNA repair protein RecN n=1 Tax=Propionicicella superfundia TaxID=348582 RepID=UPI0003FA414C|nr:DNA repair protein RecN [Propionicicella superfundia]